MSKTIIPFLLAIVSIASYVHANSYQPPPLIEIATIEYDQTPIPGENSLLVVHLKVNQTCSASMNIKCMNNIELANPERSHTEYTCTRDQYITEQIEYIYEDTETSRIEISILATDVNGISQTPVTRLLTFVPQSQVTDCVGAKIGVYFDSTATSFCLADSTNFPFLCTAYIIATNYNENLGIVAWEGSLDWSSGLIVQPATIYHNGINFSQFPNFTVGVPDTVPVQSCMILASMPVIAFGPGDIYLKGASGASSPSPCFIDATSPTMLEFDYRYGDWLQPVASVGQVECPTSNDHIDYTVVDSWIPVEFDDSTNMDRVIVPRCSSELNTGEKTLYTVDISGKVKFSVNDETSYGVYGPKVRLYFRNPTAGWSIHPISGDIQNIHYDLLDEDGSYNFNFSFSGNLDGYTQIQILVNTSNTAVSMPRPADGYRFQTIDGHYTFYLNEIDGAVIYINPQNPNINYYVENTSSRADYGSILRNAQLSKEFLNSVYSCQVPYEIPIINTQLYNLDDNYAGMFHSCGGLGDSDPPLIQIDYNSYYTSWVIMHEYGHYIHYCTWGQDCSDEWENGIENTSILKEGWAINFSFMARNYVQNLYAREYLWDALYTSENTETAPYRSPRYGNISYNVTHPEYCAYACFLWNLYDGVEESVYDVYSGDNDDISISKLRVFESLRTMNRNRFLNNIRYYEKYIEGLATQVQGSVSEIFSFMATNLIDIPADYAMRPVQVSNFDAEILHSDQVEFSWDSNEYISVGDAYRNAASGYHLYKYGVSWDLIASIPRSARSYLYTEDDVAGMYKLTSYNNISGDSCMQPELTVGTTSVENISVSTNQITHAFPTPFNAHIDINYSIIQPTNVRINIFDARGMLVATLINKWYERGNYTCLWNGNDDSGNVLASGVYFVQLVTNIGEDVKKVVMIK